MASAQTLKNIEVLEAQKLLIQKQAELQILQLDDRIAELQAQTN